MKRISDGKGFALCVAASVVSHAALLFSFAPVLAPTQARASAEGFRMIQAVVASRPKPAVVPPRPEPVKKASEAAVVSEESPEEPPEDAPEEPLSPPSSEPSTADAPSGAAVAEGSGSGDGNEFLPFYKVDVKPEFIERAELLYPVQARKLGKEGSVIVEADIDARSALADVRLVRKAGFGFDESALAMIKGSRFAPAYAAGRPVPVRMRFTVNFKLRG